MTRIKYPPEQAQFLEANANKIVVSDGAWYYIPYWFKKTTGVDNEFEKVSFDKLPEHLKALIKSIQEENTLGTAFGLPEKS